MFKAARCFKQVRLFVILNLFFLSLIASGEASTKDRTTEIKIGDVIPSVDPELNLKPGHWEVKEIKKAGLTVTGVVLEAKEGRAPEQERQYSLELKKGAKIPGREENFSPLNAHPIFFKLSSVDAGGANRSYQFEKFYQGGIVLVHETYQVGESTYTTQEGKKLPRLPINGKYKWVETSRARGGILPITKPEGALGGERQPDVVTYALTINPALLKHGEEIADRFSNFKVVTKFNWKAQKSPTEDQSNQMLAIRKRFEEEEGRKPLKLLSERDLKLFMANQLNIQIRFPHLKSIFGEREVKRLPRNVANARPKGPTINLPKQRLAAKRARR